MREDQMPDEPTGTFNPPDTFGEDSCAQCGATPTTPWNIDPDTGLRDYDYHLCVLCASDESTPVRSFTPAAGETTGLAGLPDSVGLPPISQITDRNQPSDTELSDGGGG